MSSDNQEEAGRTVQVTQGPLQDFKIHYHDVGQGPAVVMLHGSGPGASGWSNFNRNIAPFVAAGFRIVLVDLPGWSKSDPVVVASGSRSVFNAAAIKGVLDHLGISKAHLVGNSMGGAAALQFALDYPETVDRLIIMGAGAGGPSFFTPMPSEGIKLLIGLYRAPTLENLRRMLDVFVFEPTALTEELVETRFRNMEANRTHLENFVESGRVNPRHVMADISARTAEITAPTLVVWGRDDRFVPLDMGIRLLWALPDARLHVFSQCGHWAQWEKSGEFNKLVIDFIS